MCNVYTAFSSVHNNIDIQSIYGPSYYILSDNMASANVINQLTVCIIIHSATLQHLEPIIKIVKPCLFKIEFVKT